MEERADDEVKADAVGAAAADPLQIELDHVEDEHERCVREGYLLKLVQKGHEKIWKRRWVLLRRY